MEYKSLVTSVLCEVKAEFTLDEGNKLTFIESLDLSEHRVLENSWLWPQWQVIVEPGGHDTSSVPHH